MLLGGGAVNFFMFWGVRPIILECLLLQLFTPLLPLAHHGAACSGNGISKLVRWPGRLALASVPHHKTNIQKNNREQMCSDGIFWVLFCIFWFCCGAAFADAQIRKIFNYIRLSVN
jgi:hypothetical protein